MNKEFFQRKIKILTNDKLVDLFQKTHNKYDPNIFELTKAELARRNITLEWIEKPEQDEVAKKNPDDRKLRKWNWGAFLLAPIWALANNLEKYAILWFIPLVNIVLIFHLGFNGSRLAYYKNSIESVDEFMDLQKQWSIWGVRIFWFSTIGGLLAGLVRYG